MERYAVSEVCCAAADDENAATANATRHTKGYDTRLVHTGHFLEEVVAEYTGVWWPKLEQKSQAARIVVSLEIVDSIPLIAEFSTAAKQALAARAIVRRYPAGRVLWRAGDPITFLAIILEGKVRVVREGAGRQHVVHTEGVGGTLGEVPLYAGGDAPATAVALVATRCLLLPRAALEAAIAAQPSVAWFLLARLASRVRVMIARMDNLAFENVSGRLAGYLLSQLAHDDRDIVLGMTQTALAEELGTVREVVVRALRTFKNAGLIEQSGRGRLRVIDAAGLKKMVERQRD